nr:NS1 [Hedgehog bufavirus]
MAVNSTVQDGLTWLKEIKEKVGLSFVFKIHETTFTPTTEKPYRINWQYYKKLPDEPDIKEVHHLDQQSVSNRTKTNGSKSPDLDYGMGPYKQALILTAIVKKILAEYFDNKNIEPNEVTWFIQSELGTDTGLHIHVLLQSEKINPRSGKWMVRYFAEKWSLYLTKAIGIKENQLQLFFNQTKFRYNIENNDWIQILTYTHPQTKKKYVKPIFVGKMIYTYFLQKNLCLTEKQTGYIYSSDSSFKLDSLSEEERHTLAKLALTWEQETTKLLDKTNITEQTPQDKKKRRIETQKETTLKETIATLSKQKLHTQEKWMLGDPDSYIQQIANPGGETLIKATLDIVTLKMAVEQTAYTLIMEQPSNQLKIKKTKIYKLLKKNGMNPQKVMHAIACCLNKQMGKRNTILFTGPASTGKSLIAQKIAQLVGNVGCYNASNVNFPFNDCSNKNLIWIEEAGNFGNQVNQFKAIMSGQAIRLDQKGKGSKTIEPTPVIMTTNEDITRVIIGSELKPEHKQPIMDRCIRLYLHVRLEGDFGLLTDEEIPAFFKWLAKKGYEPTLASYCQKWGAPPTWEENWNKKPNKAIPEQTSVTSDEENTEPEEPKNPTPKKSLTEILDPLGQDADFQLLMQSLESDDYSWEGHGQELIPDATN